MIANSDLDNVELFSVEAGYLGKFLDNKLSFSLDIYFNLLTNEIITETNMIPSAAGLPIPDLDRSFTRYVNLGSGLYIFGSELGIQLRLSKAVSLLASLAHREVFEYVLGKLQASSLSPKNLMSLGGNFQTPWGLVGSLHAFSRSDFWDLRLQDPGELSESSNVIYMDNAVLIMGKLGWQWKDLKDIELEVGCKIFLPISLSGRFHFRFYEKGGWIAPDGEVHGGMELRRMFSVYLRGKY
jgi:hypothetical protein